MLGDIVAWVVISLLGLVALAVAAGILIYMPVAVNNEAICLRKGYPRAATSVYLEGYCMNLEGSVTVKVESLK